MKNGEWRMEREKDCGMEFTSKSGHEVKPDSDGDFQRELVASANDSFYFARMSFFVSEKLPIWR